MFLQWCRDVLHLSFIFVQRFVSWDRTWLRKGTTAETQTLAAMGLDDLNLWTMKTDIIHKSKVGLEILIPIMLVLGTVTTIMTINQIWIGLIICGLIILFVAHIYVGTYYKITNDHRLFIRCGILESFDINVDDIEWIKKTSELTNAPALSVDRLEIGYKGGRVLISPRDKKKFVDDLKKLNTKIWWTG